MRLHRTFIAIAAASLLERTAVAQAPAAAFPAVGVWRGASVCLVRPSACNDEIVVYRVTRIGTTDSVSLDARKIVNGQEQEMGVLPCSVIASGARLACVIPRGTWHFAVRGDSLVGELRLSDDTRFRDVRAVRAAQPHTSARDPLVMIEVTRVIVDPAVACEDSNVSYRGRPDAMPEMSRDVTGRNVSGHGNRPVRQL